MYINTFFNPLKAVASSLFLLATCLLYAQDCNLMLEGKIVSLNDNTPLEAAVVQVKETNQNVLSSRDGRFVIDQLCAGKLTLIFLILTVKTKLSILI